MKEATSTLLPVYIARPRIFQRSRIFFHDNFHQSQLHDAQSWSGYSAVVIPFQSLSCRVCERTVYVVYVNGRAIRLCAAVGCRVYNISHCLILLSALEPHQRSHGMFVVHDLISAFKCPFISRMHETKLPLQQGFAVCFCGVRLVRLRSASTATFATLVFCGHSSTSVLPSAQLCHGGPPSLTQSVRSDNNPQSESESLVLTTTMFACGAAAQADERSRPLHLESAAADPFNEMSIGRSGYSFLLARVEPSRQQQTYPHQGRE